jgi:L-malate glycosyltransferase
MRHGTGAGPAVELDRPATIVFFMDQIFDDHGGTEGQLLRLIADLDRRRFRPVLIILYRLSDFVESGRIPCETTCLGLTTMRRPDYWAALAGVARRLRSEPRALLHSIFPECATAGPWLARLACVPHVTWRRDLGFWLTPAKRRLLRWSGHWTACCVANSEAVREQVIAAEGLRRERVAVVRNAADLTALAAVEPLDVRAALGLPADRVIVVLPANLRPVKGADVALAALALARADGLPLHLVVIGDHRSLLDRYRRLCAELGIVGAVSFLGHRPREELLRWVKGCDLAVNASHSEGYSNSNVECMLLGLPLVATAVGGNCEQIQDGVTGRLVPVGDAVAMAASLRELGGDLQQRRKLGAAAARTMRERHGRDEIVPRHEAIYARLLDSRSRAIR